MYKTVLNCFLLILMGVSMSLKAKSMNSLFKIGQEQHGFRLLSKTTVEEFDGTSFLFEHVKTGARLLYFSNKDDNKLFSIAFKTPISDSTGVPHILEHSLFCGSKKYPVKEPFVELMKGSLQTFLNAMTASEHTIYPVASRNDKDFVNLMDVYLDSVFNPLLVSDPLILSQEGWRLEKNSQTGELSYNGVVYNEMKGMFSNPEFILGRMTLKRLYPNTVYQFESGGDPIEIPTLDQEKFVSFFNKYYHPSNSYIFLYGNGDIETHLAFLDKGYLGGYSKKTIDVHLTKETPFQTPKEFVEHYSIDSKDKTQDKTYLSQSYSIDVRNNPELVLGFEILNYILLSNSSSPLSRAILDAQIGRDVSGSYEDDTLQTFFSVIVRGSNPEKKELFQTVVEKALKKLVKKGIDPKIVDSSIQRLEFLLREKETGTYPKGLLYNRNVLKAWIHGDNPLSFIQFEKPMSSIKKKAKKGFFEKLISEYLLKNNHRITLTLMPKPGLDHENALKLKEELKSLKDKLSIENLSKISQIDSELKKKIDTGDKPENLKKIPLLSLNDVKKDAEQIPIQVEPLVLSKEKKSNEESPVLIKHDMFTNKISYVSLYFNLSNLDENLLPYASLLTDMLSSLSTEKYKYQDLNSEINQQLGGLHFYVQHFVKKDSLDEYSSYLVVEGKALTEKIPKLFSLVYEILIQTKFSELKRIKELLLEAKTSLDSQVVSSGNYFAELKALSYFSKYGVISDRTGGLAYYDFLNKLSSSLDDVSLKDIGTKMKEVCSKVFVRNRLHVSYTGSKADFEAGKKPLSSFITKLPTSSFEKKTWVMSNEGSLGKEAFVIPSKVQYVSLAADYTKSGLRFDGKLLVIKNILSKDFLWTKIRVQGGAYGARINLGRSGLFSLTSYRDPNLKETLDNYRKIPDYLSTFNLDEREMRKYILGTINELDQPLSSSLKAQQSNRYYFMGVTYEDLQKERQEILTMQIKDVQTYAPALKSVLTSEYYSVVGNEKVIQDNKNLFNNIIRVKK